MSIKNFYSEPLKMYQNLNVNSIAVNTLKVETETIQNLTTAQLITPKLMNEGDFNLESYSYSLPWVNDSSGVTLGSTVWAGVITVTNLPNLSPGADANFIVSNGYVGESIVLVNCNYLSSYAKTSCSCTILSSGGGSFTIEIRNVNLGSAITVGTIELSFLMIRI